MPKGLPVPLGNAPELHALGDDIAVPLGGQMEGKLITAQPLLWL